MVRTLMQRFFSERSFPLSLKIAIYSITLVVLALLFFIHKAGFLSYEEWRLILYAPFLLIFISTFFCGLTPGISHAVLSSILAAATLASLRTEIGHMSVAGLEVFPFVAMYFLVAIVVDWFRENIDRLQEQLEENKRLHEQARHMEKLALAGEIAAGIAHEIRNPLTVVQGYLQLIAAKCLAQCEHAEEDSFDLLQNELKRANQIISDFLRFSRPDAPRMSWARINDIIESAVSLLYGEALTKGVQIIVYPDPDMPESMLDRDQMVQVFLNLFSNAIQAMPGGGTVSIYTAFEKEVAQAQITVADSGIGMAPEIQERIFSPFFTTKDEGTGLGLAITQTIIVAHGGQITVESKKGEGTAFRITLPIVTDFDKSQH